MYNKQIKHTYKSSKHIKTHRTYKVKWFEIYRKIYKASKTHPKTIQKSSRNHPTIIQTSDISLIRIISIKGKPYRNHKFIIHKSCI